jgi:hypothetical protein
VDTFIHRLSNGGRVIAGQFDDPYQLDEKGIFDLVNLNRDDLGGIPGARRPPGKDVFTGFNLFSIALEVPIGDLFPNGVPHNGVLNANSTDSLLRSGRGSRGSDPDGGRRHHHWSQFRDGCRWAGTPYRSSMQAWWGHCVRRSTCAAAP